MEYRVREIQCWQRHIPRMTMASYALCVDKMRKYRRRISALEEVTACLPPHLNGQVTAECILKVHDLALFPDSGSGGLCKARKHV